MTFFFLIWNPKKKAGKSGKCIYILYIYVCSSDPDKNHAYMQVQKQKVDILSTVKNFSFRSVDKKKNLGWTNRGIS